MTLDGPFSIYTKDAKGALTETLASGEHYKTDEATFQAFADLLAPYRVSPAPLQNVWAGDDPADPVWTVALRFPDAATAALVTDAMAKVGL